MAPPSPRRVAIGADHGGFALKATLTQRLQALGVQVQDMGTHSPAPCDYPPIGFAVARAVATGVCERGVLICKSGLGIAMVANKVPAVRAAVCHSVEDAVVAREHNDANVLVLGAERVGDAEAVAILERWFATAAQGGRHARRVRQILAVERETMRPVSDLPDHV